MNNHASMMSPDFPNDRANAVSKYHFPSLNTEHFSEHFSYRNIGPRPSSQHRHQHGGRHVHFNALFSAEAEQQQEQQQELEVSCEHNPTQLFLLMNRQLWDKALAHLHHKPIEAHVWISSRFPYSDEYKWCNLPLHLACLYGPEPAPLAFMQCLIDTYPGAAQCRNHEGNLPIHLACDCMDLSPKFGLEVEGILVTLIKAFPECLSMRDSRGRRPIDILEEQGIRALKTEQIVGRGVGIMKYMRAQARSMGMVEEEQRQEREIYATSGEKSRRRPRNNEMPHTSRDKTTSNRRERKESIARSKSAPPRDLRNVELPNLSNDTTPHQREKTEPRDHSKTYSRIDINGQSPPAFEKQFHLSPSNKSLHTVEDQSQNDRLVVEPHPHRSTAAEPPISPFNPMPAVTPQNIDILALAKENFDPFHQLDAELNSMRMAHQSMSKALSSKNQTEDELQERLRKLEVEYAELKAEYMEISKKSNLIQDDLEEKTKALENSRYELKIMKSKEKAISAELALKLEVEGKQHIELNQIKSELATVNEARDATTKKLDHQTKMSAEFKETMEKCKSANEKLSHENEQLSRQNKEMRAQLEQKNILIHDAKRKESTLLEMLSKMHTKEDLEDAVDRGKRESDKLAKENKELKKQMVQKSKQVEDAKTKESEWKALTAKVKNTVEITKLENEELTRKSEELHMQFAQQKEELLETKENESRLAEQLRETNEKNGPEAEELSAKNIALRVVAVKAIETVCRLQQRVNQIPPSGESSKGLEELLKDAESTSIIGAGHARRSRMLNASESLALLHPIINDAQNLQQDTIERIQQLLQQSYDTMKLTGQISSIHNEKFEFEPTLHFLEGTITSHVDILESLSNILEMKENCHAKLIAMLNRHPLQAIKNISVSTKNTDENTRALSSTSISAIRDHTAKLISIAHKHLEKLESLSKTVAGLPQMKRINLDSRKNDVRKHLRMVDEITSVLRKALSNLVQDAKQIKLLNQTIQGACAI